MDDVSAKGLRGTICGAGQTFWLRTCCGKNHKIGHPALSIRILSADAVFRESKAGFEQKDVPWLLADAIDYDPAIFGSSHDPAEYDVKPAVGTEGKILNFAPCVFKTGCKHFLLWHGHLEVEIIDETAVLREQEGKHCKYWDGSIDRHKGPQNDPLMTQKHSRVQL